MDIKKLKLEIDKTLEAGKHITFLVGAGLSAESGIPTFRGKEGYWKVGSKNYTPQEIGTYRMFQSNPLEVWKWYLFRKTVCNKAEPNRGHLALKKLEELIGDQFALVTQNVDGLYLRAGNSLERTYPIHGDLSFARCGVECTSELHPFPDGIGDKGREDEISAEEEKHLKCPNCGAYLRPHVLWFDEYYNERFYKFQTVQKIADNTGLLFVIGTSGATYLPSEMIDRVSYFDASIVDINIANNDFTDFLSTYPYGHLIRDTSSNALSALVGLFG